MMGITLGDEVAQLSRFAVQDVTDALNDKCLRQSLTHGFELILLTREQDGQLYGFREFNLEVRH